MLSKGDEAMKNDGTSPVKKNLVWMSSWPTTFAPILSSFQQNDLLLVAFSSQVYLFCNAYPTDLDQPSLAPRTSKDTDSGIIGELKSIVAYTVKTIL